MSIKPNPVSHMIRWGFVSGTSLPLLYFAIILRSYINSANSFEILQVLFEPSLWIIGFGGGVGAILGFLNGLLLWVLMQDAPIPFTHRDIQSIRFKIYGAMAFPMTVVGFLVTGLILDLGSNVPYILLFLYLFFAGILSAYAAHCYLFGLRLWSERNYGLQMEKVKNVERLEDKPKNDRQYDE